MEFFQHHKCTNRLAHSLNVSYKSFKFAEKLGFNDVSKRELARAGLLHDLFLYDCSDKVKGHLKTHPEVALKNALTITSLSEREQNIILSHMFLISFKHLPKYKESFLLTTVDKIVSFEETFLRFFNKKQKFIANTKTS